MPCLSAIMLGLWTMDSMGKLTCSFCTSGKTLFTYVSCQHSFCICNSNVGVTRWSEATGFKFCETLTMSFCSCTCDCWRQIYMCAHSGSLRKELLRWLRYHIPKENNHQRRGREMLGTKARARQLGLQDKLLQEAVLLQAWQYSSTSSSVGCASGH